jgi:hypothetical protein
MFMVSKACAAELEEAGRVYRFLSCRILGGGCS